MLTPSQSHQVAPTELRVRGEVLPEGRTNEEEARLVKVGAPELPRQASEGGQTAAS